MVMYEKEELLQVLKEQIEQLQEYLSLVEEQEENENDVIQMPQLEDVIFRSHNWELRSDHDHETFEDLVNSEY